MAKIKVKKNEYLERYEEIEIEEPTVRHITEALKMVGKERHKFPATLLSLITKFDGKKQPVEEVEGLPLSDCLALLTELTGTLQIDINKFTANLLRSLGLPTGATTK